MKFFGRGAELRRKHVYDTTMSDGGMDSSTTTQLLLIVLQPLPSKLLVFANRDTIRSSPLAIIMSATAMWNEYGDGTHAKTSLNTVNRYKGRGQYEYKQVYPIIDEAPILHVAFQTSPDKENFGFPIILPMLGCTGKFQSKFESSSTTQLEDDNDGRRYVYLHGYVSSRIMRLSHTATATTAPLSSSGTHKSSSMNPSAICMELITNNLVPDRWQHTRYPNGTELKSTGILRIDIHSASAKVRTGTTGETRDDLKNEEMRKDVWAGVVPFRWVYGEPIPAPTNMFPGTPRYIEEWIKGYNETTEAYSVEAGQ
ncbi:hypothetical protein G7Y89_g8290 [Cudoniella acicularis]|uniref:Uncharacterized protein n=1 Tax=Cudoniella acicularis TaxID=354080 RepID=A0A8H4RJ64_9HELO|nr:hypothetical protein G7Y89_g8290 [Cudoniella acicularis]